MKLKINWSGKSHNFNYKEKYLLRVLDSDNLTQGRELVKFESSKYLNKKNIFCTSSAAASLEIIAILLKLKKGMRYCSSSHILCISYFICAEWSKNYLGRH